MSAVDLVQRLWPNGLGPENLEEVAIFIEEERKCEAEYRAAKDTALAEADRVKETNDALKDKLHSCVCLLEVMADSAKERGDDVEWAMMSVMAKNGREVLDGYHPE